MGKYYIILAAFIFGVAGAYSKILFNNQLSPVALTAFRSLVAFLSLGILIGFIERSNLKVTYKQFKFLCLLGLALTLVNIFFYLSIFYTNVAIAITLEYTSPIIILLYSFFMKNRKISKAELILSFASVAGCVLITGAYQYHNENLFNLKGVVFGFLCAGAFAGYNILGSKKDNFGLSTSVAIFYTFMISAIIWIPFYFSFDYDIVFNELNNLYGIFFIGIFATLIPYWLYLEGLKSVDPYRATILGLFDPVVAAVAAYLMLGEKLEIPQLLGFFILFYVIAALAKQETGKDR